MKLFLVYPEKIKDVRASAQVRGSTIQVTLDPQPGPLPVTITVRGSDRKELFRVYRAGHLVKETVVFPLGSNREAGEYLVEVAPMLPGVKSFQQKVAFRPEPASDWNELNQTVRVFHPEQIRTFLAGRPLLTIALSNEEHRTVAEGLARDLAPRGFKVKVKKESEVARKVVYPRVWNPHATVWSVTDDEKPVEASKVKRKVTLGVNKLGVLTCRTTDGKDVRDDWRQPGSLITIVEDGFCDYSGDREVCYEPGVKLFIEEGRQVRVLRGVSREEKTTAEVRSRWARPWDRLTTHVGGYQLPPQLPEAWTTSDHLIVLGDSKSSTLVAALQASELSEQVVDARYPGPGKALIQMSCSPFGQDRNVIHLGASDRSGIEAAVKEFRQLLTGK
ncbi:MAG: hypothetical protein U0840_07060 [Gemmataceae bacterium]